jgi:hypothetical protein
MEENICPIFGELYKIITLISIGYNTICEKV